MKFIYIIFSMVSFVLSIIAIIILFTKNQFSITSSDFYSILGTVITSISFLIGTYFVIIAVSIYSQLKDVESLRNSVEIMHNTSRIFFDKIKKENEYISVMMVNMDDYLSEQINIYRETISEFPGINEKNKEENRKRLNKLIKIRARLAFRKSLLQRERRLNLLRELSNVGELSDIDNLKEIIEMEGVEDQEVKELVEMVIRKIYEKYNIVN